MVSGLRKHDRVCQEYWRRTRPARFTFANIAEAVGCLAVEGAEPGAVIGAIRLSQALAGEVIGVDHYVIMGSPCCNRVLPPCK